VADYYAVLGIERSASEVEIKRAYRGLARQHHPDVAADKVAGEARFKEITEAYEVLSDPQKRQHYDRFGSAPGPGPGGGGAGPGANFGGGEGFGDIFDMFFGARGGGGGRGSTVAGPQRGADLRYDMHITLEDAYTGLEREIEYAHLASCDTCRGSGAAPGTLVTRCERCGGTGAMRAVRQTPLGQFVTQTTCTTCGGEGTVIPTPCKDCHGHGRLEKHRSLTVKVPPGVDDGSRIRISGNGEGGTHGGPPGDLYVYLGIKAHERFRRDGADLYLDVPISFTQAALGSDFDVDSLGGAVPLAVVGGTQSGTTLRVRGAGMPTMRGSAKGDLLATVHVMVPAKLSRRERELLEEYAAIGGDAVDSRSFMDRVKDAFAP